MSKLRLRSERQLKLEMGKSKPKKSVRLMMQSYKIELNKKAKENYVWPRTVEAAQDPFRDATGKNKMLYVIACNLFPEKKIVQPSDTESDSEQGSQSQVWTDYDDPTNEDFMNGRSLKFRKIKRRQYRSQHNDWRSQYNHNHRRIQKRRIRPNRLRIVDRSTILEVIENVVERARACTMNNESLASYLNLPAPVEVIPYSAASDLDRVLEEGSTSSSVDGGYSEGADNVHDETQSNDEDDSSNTRADNIDRKNSEGVAVP